MCLGIDENSGPSQRGFTAAIPLESVSSLSGLVFLTQNGPRQKLKISPGLPGNELSEYVFLNSVR
jgi:hypothetical protein